MDFSEKRGDFTFLNTPLNKKGLPIYLDNACQTLRPESVINRMAEYYRITPTCAGRSVYSVASELTKEIVAARETIAAFVGVSPDELIFTRNTSEGLNLVARGYPLFAGDEIVITDKEHNSNLLPWLRRAKETGALVRVVKTTADNTFDLEAFRAVLSEKTKIVAINHVSNLDGVTNPIEEITKEAKKFGAVVVVDGAQAFPHKKINVREIGCDAYSFSGHKALGPSGTGALYLSKEIQKVVEPLNIGGGTVEYSTYESYEHLEGPEKYEAGLQDFAGILGFAEAVRYLSSLDFSAMEAHVGKLNQITTGYVEKHSDAVILGPREASRRGGILSFFIKDVSSHEIAVALDSARNIMTRSGEHCVHSWFRAHGIRDSLRASFYFYNTEEEARAFGEAITQVYKTYK